MKRIKPLKKLSGFFIAVLTIALVFLAVGLGTLGSTQSVGSAYELVSGYSGESAPYVVFRLSNLTEEKEDGTTSTTRLRLTGVQVNIAAIYAEAGTSACLRVERSASQSGSFLTGSGLDGVIENYITPDDVIDESGKVTTDYPEPDAKDALFRYVSPFTFPATGWSVSSYPYVRIMLKNSPNVLINEVVFIGEKLDSNSEGTGEYAVVPATVVEATPYANETAKDALARAAALLDAQPEEVPSDTQSTYFRYGDEELYTLATISEMRMGNVYATDQNGNAVDVYHLDAVYGAFGHDILALGIAIFGMSPFGLRFFPMLAAFGVLLVLSRFAVRLFRSEKAGLIFSLLYVLSGIPLALGHLGTPLMLGIFFFVCALDLVHRFYANGVKAKFVYFLPQLLAGLFGAAAICVNGAFVLPVAGVVALFVLAVLRMQKAKKYELEKIANGPAPAPQEGKEETPEKRAGRVVAQYRFRTYAIPALFAVGLILGTMLFALVGMIPAYYAYLKFYDNPAAPAATVFTLAWRAFAGGFTGVNPYGSGTAWHPFYKLFEGSGTMYAITAMAVNPVTILAGIGGVLYGAFRLVMLLIHREHTKVWRAELRRASILLCGFVLSLIAGVAVKNGGAFVALTYLFAFLLAAGNLGASYEGKAAKAVKIVNIVGLVLAAVCCAALLIFTLSIPLPEAFWNFLS